MGRPSSRWRARPSTPLATNQSRSNSVRPTTFVARRSARNTEKADFNVLVSNVRITARDWRIGGQRIAHPYLSGPPGDDTGLNITVVGYDDLLHVTVVGNPVTMTDPDEVVDGLHAALEELTACTV
mgnify:CR=1 FL=1